MTWSFIDPQGDLTESFPERIYTHFFDLHETPFSITPDPEFLYLSDTHQNVFEKLQYGIRGRMGFMLLTGEVGTGKTTLCRALLDRLQEQAKTVYIINPSLSGHELLVTILDDLGIYCDSGLSKKELIDQLNRFLLVEGRSSPVVIVIDDAQTMPLETMEDLRLLSNLETDKTKLLQILLAGQPELLCMIDRPQLRQLKQRVLIHCSLGFLSPEEVAGYIERRLAVAGNQGQVRFTPKAIQRIYGFSGGIPRMINKLCDLALTAAYAADSPLVDTAHVAAARSELIAAPTKRSMVGRSLTAGFSWLRKMAYFAAGLLLLSGAVLGYQVYSHRQKPLGLEKPAATLQAMENRLEPVE